MTPSRLRHVLRTAGAALSLSIPMLAGAVAVGAQEATPAGPPPLPANCTVVASGLFNPRSIAVDADGSIYVAEAGDAGANAVFATPEAGTPAPAEPLTSYGVTGQITKIAPDGTPTVLTTGLPSYTFGEEIVGPSGVTIANGTLYATVGGPGPLTAVAPSVPNRDAVITVDLATGTRRTLTDIGAYERSNNPDPNAIDSNLTGIAVGADGTVFVADAGGNTVYKVDGSTGAISVLAVIPGLPSPGGAPNDARGGAAEVDPVPTGLVATADGGVDLGLLSGAILWGTPGSAKVIHIAPDGTISDVAGGLNMVVGVATAPDGTVYASQFSENLFAQPPAAGSVARVNPDGTVETVLPGLFLPYGIAFDADGNLYVAINSSAPSGTPPQGQVLRCDVGAGGGAASPVAGTSNVVAAAVSLDFVDIAYKPNALSIPANQDVTINLTDSGAAPHNFNIDDLNIHTETLQAGGTATVTINAAPGTYSFYCNIPGHKQAGMVGTLTVQ